MPVAEVRWSEAFEAFISQYDTLTEAIGSLQRDDLARQSGCKGWTNADLIFHLQFDAHRALVTFNTPVAGPADINYVDYWRGYQAGDESAKLHAKFVHKATAALSDVTRVSRWWLEAAPAAVRAARATENIGHVTTQGHVFRIPDFLATLVVEATVHHLDLNVDPGPRPASRAVALTVKTLDGLLDAERPEGWDDLSYLRKATGREALDRRERKELGDAADRLPLFS
jgi:hypothetical protein